MKSVAIAFSTIDKCNVGDELLCTYSRIKGNAGQLLRIVKKEESCSEKNLF